MKAGFGILCAIMVWHSLAVTGQDPGSPVVTAEDQTAHAAEQYNRVLADALQMQLRADSLGRIARDRRIYAREIPDASMKGELSREALRLESEARVVQDEADRLFSLARKIREENAASASAATDLVLLKTVSGIRVYAYKTDTVTRDGRGNAVVIADERQKGISGDQAAESGIMAAESVIAEAEPGHSETEPIVRAAESVIAATEPVTAFDVFDDSPYGESNPYPILTKVEKGLVYHIQLGAFSSPATFDAFAGIVPVFVEVTGDRKLFKYYAGSFTDLRSVTRALERIRMAGFTDAFIVAFLNGRQITTEEAREIEYAEFKL